MKEFEKLHLLLVDDEDGLRDVIEIYLRSRKIQVTTAQNGNEAFEIYIKNKFDIVITDIMMPGKDADGVTLTRRIRNHHSPQPFIIAITGHAKETKPQILEAGANAILYKPFMYPELLELIADA